MISTIHTYRSLTLTLFPAGSLALLVRTATHPTIGCCRALQCRSRSSSCPVASCTLRVWQGVSSVFAMLESLLKQRGARAGAGETGRAGAEPPHRHAADNGRAGNERRERKRKGSKHEESGRGGPGGGPGGTREGAAHVRKKASWVDKLDGLRLALLIVLPVCLILLLVVIVLSM